MTKERLHLYLHRKTGLASFKGLRYLHVDIDDIETYTIVTMAKVNKSYMLEKDMLHYVPPQLCFPQYKNLDE